MAGSGAGEAAKAAGNEQFKRGEFLKAAASYTKAIKAEPENHVFYSNRAQAFLKISKVNRALEDADRCIELAPDFVKGYHRKALALAALGRKDEACDVALKACQMEPDNKELIHLGVSIRGVAFAHEIAALRKTAAHQGKAGAPESAAAENRPVAQPEAAAKAAPSPVAANVPAGGPRGAADEQPTPYYELTAQEFAAEVIRTTFATIMQGEMPTPKVYLQPPRPRAGSIDKEAPSDMGVVAIDKAFESPTTLLQCTEFLRSQIASTFKAQTAAVVTLKSRIAYPRVWVDKGKRFGTTARAGG